MEAKVCFCRMDRKDNCKFPWSHPGCIEENAWQVGKQSPRIKLFDGFMGNVSSFRRQLNYNFN